MHLSYLWKWTKNCLMIVPRTLNTKERGLLPITSIIPHINSSRSLYSNLKQKGWPFFKFSFNKYDLNACIFQRAGKETRQGREVEANSSVGSSKSWRMYEMVVELVIFVVVFEVVRHRFPPSIHFLHQCMTSFCVYHLFQASKVAELLDHNDFNYATSATLPECNNNDLTFSVKESSHGKKADHRSHSKVPDWFFQNWNELYELFDEIFYHCVVTAKHHFFPFRPITKRSSIRKELVRNLNFQKKKVQAQFSFRNTVRSSPWCCLRRCE